MSGFGGSGGSMQLHLPVKELPQGYGKHVIYKDDASTLSLGHCDEQVSPDAVEGTVCAGGGGGACLLSWFFFLRTKDLEGTVLVMVTGRRERESTQVEAARNSNSIKKQKADIYQRRGQDHTTSRYVT